MDELSRLAVSSNLNGKYASMGISDFELESLLRQRPLVPRRLTFLCPACGNQLKADPASQGKVGRCPACAMRVPVPGQPAAAAP